MNYDDIYKTADNVKALVRTIRAYEKDTELKLQTVNGYGGNLAIIPK